MFASFECLFFILKLNIFALQLNSNSAKHLLFELFDLVNVKLRLTFYKYQTECAPPSHTHIATGAGRKGCEKAKNHRKLFTGASFSSFAAAKYIIYVMEAAEKN